MKRMKSGGGWAAIRYTLRMANKVGWWRLWRAMRSKNACKTCALGMGGQKGGMKNEAGHFPEVCKKSLQAMAADMQGRIEPRFFETYSLTELKGFSPRELEHMGRLTEPLMARPGDTHYRIVDWETALTHVANSLKQTKPERAFFYASGRSSNEAGFLLHLLARSYGTNHVSNCSFYCHQASGVGLSESIGTKTATIDLGDLDECDLLFLIGGNPASNHPRLMTSLMRLRERGGHVVVVNPMKETGLVNFKVPSSIRSMVFGSEIASAYVQPKIGGDIAFLAGLAKCLIERGGIDQEYITSFTEQYGSLSSYIHNLTWNEIAESSGVQREVIESVAKIYMNSERTVFAWTMGITHHEHGVENVQWIVNLALMRGMIGKPGAGLLPIRGHSNVQGMGTIGVSPQMSRAAVERISKIGLKEPAFEGYDTIASMNAAGRGELDFGLCLGGNLFGASPDADFSRSALGQVDTVVYLSTSLNSGHVHGLGKTTLILPVQARDEEAQSTTQESMFSYVRLSEGGESRHMGPRSETVILCEIAQRTLNENDPLNWMALANHDEVRKLIAHLVPELEKIKDIGQTKSEFQIPGRLFPSPVFKTASGRAVFHTSKLPNLQPLGENQVRLMTIRSEGQFNTVVYEEEDIYRGQERRDVILMNTTDMDRIGLSTDQMVEITSDVGTMCRILVRPFDIAKGCAAMYFPEANILVPKTVDPRSKTPSFKSVVVKVSLSTAKSTEPLIKVSLESGSRKHMKSC